MIKRCRATTFVAASFAAATWAAANTPASAATEETVSYELDVFPILQSRCVSCHSPGNDGYEASGLDMRTYEALMKGTRHGPMVLPGRPDESNLVRLISGKADVMMPHDERPLLKYQVSIIRDWVKQGAANN